MQFTTVIRNVCFSMKRGNKELLVVGDRVLVKAEQSERMTKVGLYLPANVIEKEEVQGGRVIAVGPGQPLPPPNDEQEPWKQDYRNQRFLPMEVVVGDHALFFRKAAIEITFDDERYLVVPHGAIVIVVRSDKDGSVPDQLPEDL